MQELAPYIIIPILTGFVGWFTNWLGIKLLLYPTSWQGVWKIGWQGVIPKMRVRITKLVVKHSISIICKPEDMIDAMDEGNAIDHLSEIISPQVNIWIDDILSEQYPAAWAFAPKHVKKQIYKATKKEIPGLAKSVLQEIKQKANHFIDIEEIAAREAEKRPEILTKLVGALAHKEFAFVIRSGLYLGIPIGCLQAVTWYFYKGSLVLPMYGLLAGAATNLFALQFLFHPATPIKFLGFEIQGLFVKRQADVASDFAEVFTSNFIDIQTVFDCVWGGKNKDEIRRLVKREFENLLDKKIITGNIFKAMNLGGQIKDVKPETINVIEDDVMYTLGQDHVSEKLFKPVNALIKERMSKLSPKQFQELLLPIFDQEKWLMIGIGAVLGFGAGTAQLVFIFGGSLL